MRPPPRRRRCGRDRAATRSDRRRGRVRSPCGLAPWLRHRATARPPEWPGWWTRGGGRQDCRTGPFGTAARGPSWLFLLFSAAKYLPSLHLVGSPGPAIDAYRCSMKREHFGNSSVAYIATRRTRKHVEGTIDQRTILRAGRCRGQPGHTVIISDL